ncbi:MAG TPA: outer membrane lipoprotein-sorting protein [Gemmobacter sp.]|nr:outer membrane lipoprotein-sorting protein [Gemmobacter sp.]
MTLDRRSFTQLLFGGAVLAGMGAMPRMALAVDAGGILAQADAIRNPQSSFMVNVDLKNYEGSALTGQTQVTTLSRRAGGQFQTLVHINAPSADRGKLLLRNGNSLWMFDPASQASVRISARQRLLGNASNGDVVSSNLMGDYSPTLAGEEAVADGDKKTRDCYKLDLKSRDKSTPYSSIEFWVDKASGRPVKGKYYAGSGKLLKVSWYRKFANQMGASRPTEVVIADGFDPNKITVMTMKGFQGRDLPESMFRKEALAGFRL